MSDQRWTTEMPTQPGWYWYHGPRASVDAETCILCIKRAGGPLMFFNPNRMQHPGKRWQPIEHLRGKWAGPIQEPIDE